jgi:hypothetical protein
MPHCYLKAFLLCCLLTYSICCEAKKVPGYIITKDADTLRGEVRVRNCNIYLGGFIFDMELFSTMVDFKASTEKHFHNYTPNDISGFGFYYDADEYIFKQFIIEYTSLVKSERSRNRFLNLVYKGELTLYRDVERITGMRFSSNIRADLLTFNYFLYNQSNGVKRVEPSDSIKTVKELLAEYNVDPEFLNQLNDRLRFKDIVEIVKLYDHWLNDRSLKAKDM